MLGGAGPAIGSAAPQAPLLASPAVCQARPVRDRARRSRPRSRPRRGQMPPVMPPKGRTATRPRTPAAAAPSHCAVVQPNCRRRHRRAMAAAQSACPAFPFGVHPWAVTCQSITKASRRLPIRAAFPVAQPARPVGQEPRYEQQPRPRRPCGYLLVRPPPRLAIMLCDLATLSAASGACAASTPASRPSETAGERPEATRRGQLLRVVTQLLRVVTGTDGHLYPMCYRQGCALTTAARLADPPLRPGEGSREGRVFPRVI